MHIGLLGTTDKRPFLYPLVKLLQKTGDVIVITPCNHMKRLIDDGDDMGYYGNTLICVTDMSPDEVWEFIKHTPNDFDHVIYDLTDTIADDVDLYIHLRGYDIDDEEFNFLDCIDEYKKVKLSYDGRRDSDKEVININLSSSDFLFIEKSENKKRFMSMKNQHIVRAFLQIFGTSLGVNKKSLTGIMKREG